MKAFYSRAHLTAKTQAAKIQKIFHMSFLIVLQIDECRRCQLRNGKSLGFLLSVGASQDALEASRIMRSNVPGAVFLKRVFRLRETAMLMVGF